MLDQGVVLASLGSNMQTPIDLNQRNICRYKQSAVQNHLLPSNAFDVVQPRWRVWHAIMTLDAMVSLLPASGAGSTVCTFRPRNASTLWLPHRWVCPLSPPALGLAVRGFCFNNIPAISQPFAGLGMAGSWRTLCCAAVCCAERPRFGITLGGRRCVYMVGRAVMMRPDSGCIIPRWQMAVRSSLRCCNSCELSDRQPQFPSASVPLPTAGTAGDLAASSLAEDRSAAGWPGVQMVLLHDGLSAVMGTAQCRQTFPPPSSPAATAHACNWIADRSAYRPHWLQ